MQWFHITVRTRKPWAPLCTAQHGDWFWRGLRRCFPTVAAVTCMPNHPHIVASVLDERDATLRFTRLLGSMTRRLGSSTPVFEPVPAFEPIADRKKLRRTIRYVVLNPCRAGLSDDPLAWRWSTHRDVVGAIDDPWIDRDTLANALGESPRDLPHRLHAYASADPTVCVEGTPPPRPAVARDVPLLPLNDVASAALSATRRDPSALRAKTPARHLFVLLAYHQGWRNPTLLGRICGIHPASVRRLARQPHPALLAAGTLTLGDPRLRRHGNASVKHNVHIPSVSTG